MHLKALIRSSNWHWAKNLKSGQTCWDLRMEIFYRGDQCRNRKARLLGPIVLQVVSGLEQIENIDCFIRSRTSLLIIVQCLCQCQPLFCTLCQDSYLNLFVLPMQILFFEVRSSLSQHRRSRNVIKSIPMRNLIMRGIEYKRTRLNWFKSGFCIEEYNRNRECK